MPEILHFLEPGEECGDPECAATHVAPPRVHPLDQDRVWQTADGRTMRLEDMSPSHRVNVVNLIKRQALQLAVGYWWSIWTSPLAPQGDMAQLAVEQEERAALDDPVAFVMRSPLVQRLTRLIVDDGLADQIGLDRCPRCGARIVEDEESHYVCSSWAIAWCGWEPDDERVKLCAEMPIRRARWTTNGSD